MVQGKPEPDRGGSLGIRRLSVPQKLAYRSRNAELCYSSVLFAGQNKNDTVDRLPECLGSAKFYPWNERTDRWQWYLKEGAGKA